MKKDRIVRLVESALLLALATVLSLIKLLDLPYGGSITAASMLPIILIAYRHGVGYGMFSALVYSLIQMLLGMSSFSYFKTPGAVIVLALFDYVLAFAVLGLGGVFRKRMPQRQALVCGTVLACVLRYICHVISGCTIWAGLSIPDSAALLYSLAYNATYMLPETIVTALAAGYIGSALDLREGIPTPVKAEGRARFGVLSAIGQLIGVAALATDVVLVFSQLQDGETGDFMIAGLSSVNWVAFAAVTAVGVLAAVVLTMIDRRRA